jgi:hypothetical protein
MTRRQHLGIIVSLFKDKADKTGGISSDNANEYGLQTISQNNGASPDPGVGRAANMQPVLLRTEQIHT